MEIEIKQMDQTGNGIGFIDNKIYFFPFEIFDLVFGLSLISKVI